MTQKILVVEDDPLNLRLFAEVLRIGGYTVVTASSSAEALEVLGRDAVDLVLLDLHLAGGPSGWDLARRIRSDTAHAGLPILAISAVGGREQIDSAIEAGCDDFIAKPVTPDGLMAAVDRALGKPAGEAG